jgi:hypothetical protein
MPRRCNYFLDVLLHFWRFETAEPIRIGAESASRKPASQCNPRGKRNQSTVALIKLSRQRSPHEGRRPNPKAQISGASFNFLLDIQIRVGMGLHMKHNYTHPIRYQTVDEYHEIPSPPRRATTQTKSQEPPQPTREKKKGPKRSIGPIRPIGPISSIQQPQPPAAPPAPAPLPAKLAPAPSAPATSPPARPTPAYRDPRSRYSLL